MSARLGKGVCKELAGQKWGGILSGFLGEALGEGKDIAFGEIEFHALHAVHGKEDDARSKRLAALDLGGKIVEAGHVDAAQAEALGGEMQNCAPEFLTGVGEGRDDKRARAKRTDGFRFLIKAGAGHGLIVVWEVGKMQTEAGGVQSRSCDS